MSLDSTETDNSEVTATIESKGSIFSKYKWLILILAVVICFVIVAMFIQNKGLKNAAIFNKKIEVGDIVYFGNYEQDNNKNNGKEKIAWRVLAKENGKVLMLSDKILDSRFYHNEDKGITWQNCSLRLWLNVFFLVDSFNENEQSIIATTLLINGDNVMYNTSGGNNTEDKIFLLTVEDISKYSSPVWCGNAQGTEYAISRGLEVSDYNENAEWWMRSPGILSKFAQTIRPSIYKDCQNSVYNDAGNFVANPFIGVRPALWCYDDGSIIWEFAMEETTEKKENETDHSTIKDTNSTIVFDNAYQAETNSTAKVTIAQTTTIVDYEIAYINAQELYARFISMARNNDYFDTDFRDANIKACTAFEKLGNYKDSKALARKIKEILAICDDFNIGGYEITHFDDTSTSNDEVSLKTQVYSNWKSIDLMLTSKVDRSSFEADIRNYSESGYGIFQNIISTYIKNCDYDYVYNFLNTSSNWQTQPSGKQSTKISLKGYEVTITIDKFTNYINGTILGVKTS